MLFESASQSFPIRLPRCTSRHDDDVEAPQSLLLPAETFPDQAFDAISVSRVGYVFLGDCQAETCMPYRALASQHGQVGIRRLLRLLEDRLEVGGLA